MRKFALATAAIAALAFSVPAFTAPALAQGVTVKVGSGDRGHHNGWRHGHHSKKVVIHRDRGRHEGWRHRNTGMSKTVIVKKRGDGSRTVIKKFER